MLSSLASVDGRRAAGGDAIPAGALLATDTTGVVTFALEKKLDDCQIQPGSEVRVLPSPDLLLDFRKGTTICSTAPGGRENVVLGALSTRVEARDPVFSVSVLEGQMLVRVSRGFVRVRPDTGDPRLVGPNGQQLVSDKRAPRAPERYDRRRLDPREQQALARMEAAQPNLDFAFPGAAGSPALERIQRKRLLRVGIEPSADSDPLSFARSFAGFMGQQWGVSVETPPQPVSGAAKALSSGEVDLVVATRSVSGSRSIPFFDDGRGRVWSLQMSGQDGRFESEVRDFLVEALNGGQYGDRYQEAFERVPAYTAVQPLLFP